MFKRYFSGLKFGMLLQIAIGPMCLLVFNTAKNVRFSVALSLVLAIALVDAFYIFLAGMGVSRILEKESVRATFKIIGSLVLMLFGIQILLGVFGITVIPGFHVSPTSANIFVQGLILTLSNPITIVFWGSVLTARIIEEHFTKSELFVFSVGLVSATLLFMTFVAVLGTILSNFIPAIVSDALNILVGALIVFFGIRMLIKKD